MKRLTPFSMFSSHEPLKGLKKQLQGFVHLLMHPLQLKRILIREIRYGRRFWSKRMWVEWQIYDTCVGNIPHITATARAQPLNVWRLKVVSDMMRRIGNDLMVLDVGCGDGAIGSLISRMGNYVTSIELPKAATFAHRRGVSSVLASDAEHLPFSSKSFDVVLASEVVEHLWDPNNFFDEAYRVLEADGYLILSTPEGRGGLFYDSHKHYFTVEGLEQMLEARFVMCEVKRLKPMDAPVPTIIVLLRKINSNKK